MVFLTATRTAALTLAVFALLHVATAGRPSRALAQVAAGGLGLAIAFSLWTTLVSDSFFLRLVGAQGDYSSGRWASIGHWLSLAGDHPWGLGLGAVRELLAGGRPALDGTALLEWPHNELVRFYVEAGPPGLLFVVLLLAVAVRRAVRVAREDIDPVQRTLALAIAADLVAEAFLQNLLNAVYHATVLFLLLTLATSPEPADESAMPLAEPHPAGKISPRSRAGSGRMTDTSIFELGLPRTGANHRPLTPLDFLAWSASVFPERTGVVYGDRRFSWGEVDRRCRRLASALRGLGVGRGDTVAVLCPNTPPMLEAHYGIPMAGAVLNALNTRLDPASIAFILEHGEAKLLLADTEWAPVVKAALAQMAAPPAVIDIVDPEAAGERLGQLDYDGLLDRGDPAFAWEPPADEWDAISLCYTSGTTGNPKGVVYHHRGAFLNAMGNALVFGLNSRSSYLWTLPMFHCNGWTYTWAVTAVGGTHVCLRKIDPAAIFPLHRARPASPTSAARRLSSTCSSTRRTR